MKSTPRHATPLARTQVTVSIIDLLARHEVEHHFDNTGSAPIEAVFSFPLPLDAAFIGMEAEIAGRRHMGMVMPARRAARTYDDAIVDGDAAVLLEQTEPGLVTISLGNLRPGEAGVVRLAFATELKVADRRARFSLPFAYRPRYGRQTLEELVQPLHDMAIEHPLTLEVAVTGLLAGLPASCPTHRTAFESGPNATVVRILDGQLDRDFVLAFDLASHLAPIGRVLPDGDTSIAYAVAMPPQGQMAELPLELCLLLDGSGSMEGDAIAQTRDALREVAQGLRDGDRIQVLRFGSKVVPMLRRPLKTSEAVRSALQQLASTLQADLGGTEMSVALRAALQSLAVDPLTNRVVILVTDGAVAPSEIEAATQLAAEAGVRIFVVAVGSSASVEVLDPLAIRTGGALERAVPAESIADGVMRQLRRARTSAAPAALLNWTPTPIESTPLKPTYPGDVLSQWVRLPSLPPHSLTVEFTDADSPQPVRLHPTRADGAMRALMGQRLYDAAPSMERESIAVRYGLLTKETSVVLVAEQAAEGAAPPMPEVVPVRHMVPHGMGFIAACASVPHYSASQVSVRQASHDFADDFDAYLDIPAFLRSEADEPRSAPGRRSTIGRRSHQLVEVLPAERIRELADRLYDLLRFLLLEQQEHQSLEDAIARMPTHDRADTTRLVTALGLGALGEPTSAVALLLLLAANRGEVLDDDSEARLVVIAGSAAALEQENDRKLARLALLLSAGLEVTVASA